MKSLFFLVALSMFGVAMAGPYGYGGVGYGAAPLLNVGVGGFGVDPLLGGNLGFGGQWGASAALLHTAPLLSPWQTAPLLAQQGVAALPVAMPAMETGKITRTYSTVNNQPLVQSPIYEQLPTVTNAMIGRKSAAISSPDVLNAAIVRPATMLTNEAQTVLTTGVGDSAGALHRNALIQSPIYEQLPTVTNAMQGTKSAAISSPDVVNAAIVRPATTVVNPTQVYQTTGKQRAAPLLSGF
jgi:hypothetical protein